MNNFTKTEALPKTGHVNEVCKEWLVREDGALAYKLQSQEITDFYKGNRFRNAVVREDFPTALHEQIKEKENAAKQAEVYRRRLMEQEQHDKRVAKEIADKLERDLQEQQQRELLESELMAQQMQEIYVNMPPVLPPAARDKNKPPPRPAKASILQQNSRETSTSNSRTHNQHNHHNHHHQQPQHQQQHQHQQQLQQQQQQQLQQQFFNDTNGYVGLALPANLNEMPTTPQRQKATNSNHLLVSDASSSPIAAQQSFNQFVEQSRTGRTPPALTNDNFNMQTQLQQQQQQQQRHQNPSTSSSASASATATVSSSSAAASGQSSSSSSSSTRRNVFESISKTHSPTATLNTPTPPTSTHQFQAPTHSPTHNAQSPPQPPQPPQPPPPPPPPPKQSLQPIVDELIEYSDVADSIRRYDISSSPNTGDAPDAPLKHSSQAQTNFTKVRSPSHENLLRTDLKFQKLSPEKYDQLVGNGVVGAERRMQQHADDIELYVDPCDYASLQEIGLPMEEIKEISKKLKQEQKDELLARRLQQMEANDGLTQEKRDRLLAIEAQDKELAKMLQDREKAKAKRAKEKARMRKNQHKESSTSSTTTLCSPVNALHCGPLCPLPQDCMSASKHSSSSASATPNNNAQISHDDQLELEAYSNPIDVIQGQRTQNGTLTNGSLTRDSSNTARLGSHSHREDDIYTLPVDSYRAAQRPASLNIGAENVATAQHQHNSMTRSENYALDTHEPLNGHDLSPRMNYSKSGTFDQNSSPTPPYMPIQGTRRSNSSEDRKKKSKDKCTHQ